MRIKEETLKNVFLFGMMPTAAAIIAVDTVPCMINNPTTAMLFIPMYAIMGNTYNKCLKKFGGSK